MYLYRRASLFSCPPEVPPMLPYSSRIVHAQTNTLLPGSATTLQNNALPPTEYHASLLRGIFLFLKAARRAVLFAQDAAILAPILVRRCQIALVSSCRTLRRKRDDDNAVGFGHPAHSKDSAVSTASPDMTTTRQKELFAEVTENDALRRPEVH